MSRWHGTRVERLQQLVGESKSDPAAKRQLEAFIYRELQRLTTSYMKRQRNRSAVDATAMAREALTEVSGLLPAKDQPEFYTMAARIMRKVLVEQAQTRRTNKKDERYVVPFTDSPSTDAEDELLAIDNCLNQLYEESPDAAIAVELHYFAGLSIADTAHLMELTPAVVKERVRYAKAWLMTKLPAARKSLH